MACLFTFFFKGTLANEHPGYCDYQNDKNRWDFSPLDASLNVLSFKDTEDGSEYYFKLCSELSANDVKRQDFTSIQPQTLMVRCDSTRCDEVLYHTDMMYRPLSTFSAEAGLVMYGDGPLNRYEGYNNYTVYSLEYRFKCNHDYPGTQPKQTTEIVKTAFNKKIRVNFESEYGCLKTGTNTPTPTPNVMKDCEYDYKIPNSDDAYDLDLATIDNGYYGNRYLITTFEQPYELFYQPCKLARCPIGANCPGASLSNVWLCNHDGDRLGNCTDFGSFGETPDVDFINQNPNVGLVFKYVTQDRGQNMRSMHISAKCNSGMPKHYIMPDMVATLENNHLELESTSSDVCTVNQPNPPYVGDMCYTEVSKQNWYLKANMTEMTKDGGYSKRVKYNIGPVSADFDLYYNPCGPINCPTNHDCQGDDYANIWVCEPDQGQIGGDTVCQAFGLFNKYKIKMRVTDMMKGFTSSYESDLQYSADVTHICDESVAKNNLLLPDSISMDERHLEFTVRDSQACPAGTGPSPTPIPPLTPEKPEPSVTPIPDPNLESVIFYRNTTHFLATDLSLVDQTAKQEIKMFQSRGRSGTITSAFSPWELIDCPDGYTCDPPGKANMWVCWLQEDGKKYCYMGGNREFNVTLQPQKSGNLDGGYRIFYKGAYDLDVAINAHCQQNSNLNSISELEQYVTRTGGSHGLGDQFLFQTDTKLACAHKFSQPIVPEVHPTPAPASNVSKSTSFSAKTANGKSVKLDLSKVQGVAFEPVAVGAGDRYEDAWIYYSPLKKASCPPEYNCDGYGEANAWKCYVDSSNVKRCYAIANGDYGISMKLSDDLNPEKGIAVTYSGGPNGNTFTVNYQCNTSVPTNMVQLPDTAYQMDGVGNIKMNADTPMVCEAFAPSGVTGGAVFLIIVVLGFSLYFIGGFFFEFIRSGEVSVPNEGFWTEVLLSIETGFFFIFTCGKRKENATTYNAI